MQWAITWANFDQGICHNMVSLASNDLNRDSQNAAHIMLPQFRYGVCNVILLGKSEHIIMRLRCIMNPYLAMSLHK